MKKITNFVNLILKNITNFVNRVLKKIFQQLVEEKQSLISSIGHFNHKCRMMQVTRQILDYYRIYVSLYTTLMQF